MIELRNVSKHYKNGKNVFTALDDISFTINRGEFAAISGPSGSGKSTLMHLIGGLDKPTSGTITVDGKNLSGMSEWELAAYRRRKVGFIFQSFYLIPHLTAIRNVMMPLTYVTVVGDKYEYAARTLGFVNLGNKLNNRPAELSGGEEQRVAIARALICKPEIILADEPTGNLDTHTGAQIFEILQNLNQEGKTVVVVTHNETLASQATRIIRLRDGKII